MASDIPPCSLENKLASGIWDSSVFVLNEFINPNIGNMDDSRNGILLEDEQVSGNIDFVRGGGEHSPLSNGCCEDVWEDFRMSGRVRQSGDLCSLTIIDFHIEGSGLRGNWKDREDFMVDSLGSNVRIDFTTMLRSVADWMNTSQMEGENFEETTCYNGMCPDLTRETTNEDCGWHAIETCPG